MQTIRDPNRWRCVRRVALAWLACFTALSGAILSTAADAAPDSLLADGKVKVYFAGIAYLGSFEFVQANYPNAQRLNQFEADKPGRLDRELRDALNSRPPQHLDLQFGLADLNAGENIVFALAVDREYVSRERYRLGGRTHTKIIAEVSAQALFFNVDSQSLVANFPLAGAINHVIEGDSVPEATLAALFDRLYFGGTGEAGFIATAVAKINSIKLKSNWGFRFQLAGVTLDPAVSALLPSSLSAPQAEQAIGQFFSAQLSSRYTIRVLPYVRGYAIGRQIPGRFANGRAFNLEVPDPDFVFRIAINRLSKFDDSGKWLYGAQARFTFAESSLERTIAEDDFRYAVYKLQGDSEGALDDWGAYEDAVENLLTELTQQLGAPNRSWIAKHARSSQTHQQLQTKKELFDAQRQ